MVLNNICYSKNYIKQVILRLDLVSDIPQVNESLNQGMINCIKNYFPIIDSKDAQQREIELTSNGIDNSKNFTIKQWFFWDKNRKNKVIISKNFIVFVFEDYQKYDDFKKRVSEIIATFNSIYLDTTCKRIGLRFINKFSLTGQLKNYFTDIVMSSVKPFALSSDKLMRLFQTVEYDYGDFLLRFQFGLFNPDFPAIIKNNEFTLDFDAYNGEITAFGDIDMNIDKFHNQIQQLFESCIKDKLRLHMGLVKND